MPVTGTPGAASVLTPDEIRMFLQDYAENNILLDTVQFTNDQINFAKRMVVGKYNALPPPLNPVPVELINEYVLVVGIAAFLMRSEAVKQLRNQATYQDGDIVSIGVDDKQALYSRMADELNTEFETLATNIKRGMNLMAAFGNMRSGYRFLGRLR